MAKFRNLLIYALSLILVASLAVGGTVAYLTDTESAVNVMTLGNVSIEQHEYERVVDANGNYTTIDVDGTTSYELKEFTQGKPLLPFVGEVDNGYDPVPVRLAQLGHNSRGGMDVLPAKNVQDKFVVVENTGKTDAYVRTIVAFEAGSVVEEDWYKLVSYSAHFTWKETQDWFVTEINGNNYYLVEFVYNGYQDIQHPNGVLSPGDYTYNSLAQVYMFNTATNEDVEALDGNKNGLFDIMVLSQAVQTAGFADAKTALDTGFGEFNEANVKNWFGDEKIPVVVTNDAELQAAIDAAVDGDTIILGADIEGNVTVTQKEGVKFTINGNGYTIDGSITVDGKSQRYETAGITIENVNFAADTLSADAYINLGKKSDNNTRYTNNVTVKNCTFDYSGADDKVAIKSYTGGDWNLTVDGCTAKAGMHSLVQVTNVEKGLTITNCKAYSKNGINLNNTPYLNMSGCEFDTKGYCVRFGVNGATNNGNFTIADSTLTSANDDGDAVIILRGTMTGATLNIKGTALTGTLDITITGSANIVK